MRKAIVVLIFLLPILFYRFKNESKWHLKSNVSEVLFDLGEEKPKHYPVATSEEMIKQGEDLVKIGKTKLKRGSKYISKHYACTSCHNLQIEDPDIRTSNPEKRLSYVKEKGIPFLQGSTFYGMVNRETWYNGDYQIKYGDLAVKSHKDLKESIQLCAEVCSQGRRLKDWELNAIVSYIWTLEYKLSDLNLTEADLNRLEKEGNVPEKREALISWVKSKYALKSPAKFVDAPPNKQEGYKGLVGNPDSGKDIYDLSCKNCHHENGESNLILDDSKLIFSKLQRNITKENHFSIYQIVRYGTHPYEGHKPYMPHYPEERMSNQQLEDLRAYIELQAN